MHTARSETPEQKSWADIVLGSLRSGEDLAPLFAISATDVNTVVTRYPMRINPYYLRLIARKGDGLYKQAVPDIREVTDEKGMEDPLNEEELSPVPGLTHKYPDRVLFLISNRCAMYCRFCNRKRKVGKALAVTEETIREGLSYIRNTRTVRDVLLSGGDPLLLPDREIFRLLSELRGMPHVEIIRIGTRTPCTLPQRITPALAKLLKGFHPLYISTHFNHPAEVTPEATAACARLADVGIPLGCQSVLLKGVNDDPGVLTSLMKKLLRIRVRPYYLFQADLVRGTSHFWTPVAEGLQIMSVLRRNLPGLAIPHYVLDLPGGGGKVPLTVSADVRY
ncbi:MAG: KamA family radical SAM protein [Deltaproteobacteria bacterium]|nr:KamA family radical SAM protein [Deltaproteobacteria bacterium]